MLIYLVRHGQTKWNQENRMQGWQNSDLAEQGIEDARKLGKKLKNITFDYIYSSPLGRAVETAELLRGAKETEIKILPELREMYFGIWEGMEFSKVKELYPEESLHFWQEPHLYQPMGGETFAQLAQRIRKGIDIIAESQAERVLAVTHGVAIRALLKNIKGYPFSDLWCECPVLKHTCLTILEYSNGNLKVVSEADSSHLDS